MDYPPSEISEALMRLNLIDKPALGEPLAGGVSSDIWRVEGPKGPVCAKRALEKLKVAADWRAPVERSIYEARWLSRVSTALPGAAPKMLGQDEATGVIALEWLAPEHHPVWKAELLDGRISPKFAAEVGRRLALIHSLTALSKDPSVETDFPTDSIFHAIRLEPYLVALCSLWPKLANQLEFLVNRTASTKRCLVHGDVSPKNILVGPSGPVFIDAECAWAGDPAFDLAFCLNHLLLKCIARPDKFEALGKSFEELSASYLQGVDWEPRRELEMRAATLLPALLLARVDGKSPAEYVKKPEDKARIRNIASFMIDTPHQSLFAIWATWSENNLGAQ